jgi:hypothetical protein
MSYPVPTKHLVTVQPGSPLDINMRQLAGRLDLPGWFDLIDWMATHGVIWHDMIYQEDADSVVVWAFRNQEHWMEFCLTWLD